MTEQSESPIGTVAQEAARLIEDMAAMARLRHSRASAPGGYAGGPARERAPRDAQGKASSARDRQAHESTAQESTAQESTVRAGMLPESQAQGSQAHARPAQERHEAGGWAQDSGATDERPDDVCSQCGAERHEASGDGTAYCRLCPLCRGIGLLRSVRPETVDLLADLAMSVAAGLREIALWSRTSDPSAAAKSAPASSPESERAPVQDIPVDDEGEG